MYTSWSHETFSSLFKDDPRKAFEYRLRVLGDPMPSEYTSDDMKYDVDTLKHDLEDIGDVSMSVDSESIEGMKEKLNKAGVKFHHLAGKNKLQELIKKNNL